MKRLCAWITALIMLAMMCAGAEQADNGSLSYTLYLPKRDMSGLKPVTCEIDLSGTLNSSERILYALMACEDRECLPAFGAGARVVWIEDSLSVLTVSIETNESISDLYAELSAYALWQTLSKNARVSGVNLILNNAPLAYNTMGAVKNPITELNELRSAALKNRLCTVYYPDKSGQYLLPYLMPQIDYLSDEDALLHYLSLTGDSEYISYWPREFDLSKGMSLEYGFGDTGRRILRLSYRDNAAATIRISRAFELSGMQQWQLLASLDMTLCTNIAHLERISLTLMDMEINGVTGRDGSDMLFENGEIARRDFHSCIACGVTVVNKSQAGDGLTAAYTLVSSDTIGDLAKLIGFSAKDFISQGDINQAYIWDDVMYIDLSAEFYARCQSLNEFDEALTAYAIVDAAYINLGVDRVAFTVEGREAKYLSQSLPLDKPLYPNMGLIGNRDAVE